MLIIYSIKLFLIYKDKKFEYKIYYYLEVFFINLLTLYIKYYYVNV